MQTRSNLHRRLVLRVQHAELRPVIADRRVQLDRDVDEAERDRSLPERARHVSSAQTSDFRLQTFELLQLPFGREPVLEVRAVAAAALEIALVGARAGCLRRSGRRRSRPTAGDGSERRPGRSRRRLPSARCPDTRRSCLPGRRLPRVSGGPWVAAGARARCRSLAIERCAFGHVCALFTPWSSNSTTDVLKPFEYHRRLPPLYISSCCKAVYQLVTSTPMSLRIPISGIRTQSGRLFSSYPSSYSALSSMNADSSACRPASSRGSSAPRSIAARYPFRNASAAQCCQVSAHGSRSA